MKEVCKYKRCFYMKGVLDDKGGFKQYDYLCNFNAEKSFFNDNKNKIYCSYFSIKGNSPACFAFLQEGCREILPDLKLVAADENLACSPLMKELAKSRVGSVAQFGQAIGSIYFGLMDL